MIIYWYQEPHHPSPPSKDYLPVKHSDSDIHSVKTARQTHPYNIPTRVYLIIMDKLEPIEVKKNYFGFFRKNAWPWEGLENGDFH